MLETVTQALDRLRRAGYRASYLAVGNRLHCAGCSLTVDPADVAIEAVVRVEGVSDAGDEGVIFAVECLAYGIKGTYTVAITPGPAAADLEVLKRLRDGRPQSARAVEAAVGLRRRPHPAATSPDSPVAEGKGPSGSAAERADEQDEQDQQDQQDAQDEEMARGA